MDDVTIEENRPLLLTWSMTFRSRTSDALTLKLGIDHQPPQDHLRCGRRYGSKRLIVEHDEPCRRLAGVDGAIPSLLAKERLCKRDRIAGDEPLLIRGD
jgi:hypothetical protein